MAWSFAGPGGEPRTARPIRIGRGLAILLAVAIAAPLAAGPARPAVVGQASRVLDVRHADSRDVTALASEGPVLVPLPLPREQGGFHFDALLVGIGWVQFVDLAAAGMGAASQDAVLPQAVLNSGRAGLGERVEVFAGEGVTLAPSARVLVLAEPGREAVRWAGLLSASGGTATVELLTDASGLVSAQYLVLSDIARQDFAAGLIEASIGGQPFVEAWAIASATAFVAPGGQGQAASASLPVPGAPVPGTDESLLHPAWPGPVWPEPLMLDPAPGGCVTPAGTWCSTTGATDPGCIAQAGVAPYAPCAQVEARTWSFNETTFCRGCPYTFYVLVDCGREMHLPLADMEGADIVVTNVITGQPVALRCRNATAAALAVGSPPPVLVSANCCGNAQLETWWGPAFDETDNAGPGRVAWGFPNCTDLTTAYDANGNGSVSCGELPPCGGELSLISPGEIQSMDCFIRDLDGLCGLYRVDVQSGGYVWSLFANCDGSPSEGFRIFHDCTEAWAAYNPLPELAVGALQVTDGCPDIQVRFDVQNLGCVEHPGGVVVRVFSDCVPMDSVDVFVPGPIPAGSSVSAVAQLAVSCSPVRIEVRVDPDDVVLECSESSVAAACESQAGVDSLASVACACVATLDAVAGGTLQRCDGGPVTLDASGSAILPCARPLYLWMDASGTPLAPASSDPFLTLPPRPCLGDESYLLQVTCDGEACLDLDELTVTCAQDPSLASASATNDCLGASAQLDCGVPAVGASYAWDLDLTLDSDANGDPGDDADLAGCQVTAMFTGAGSKLVRLLGAGTQGCVSSRDLSVVVGPPPPAPQPWAGPACAGLEYSLGCGTTQAGVTHEWDLDLAVDSDGNGGLDDDVDAVGCAITAVAPAGPRTARVRARGTTGCSTQADLLIDGIVDDTPAEALGLQLQRANDLLSLSWQPVGGAPTHRLVAGTIGNFYSHRVDGSSGSGVCDTWGLANVSLVLDALAGQNLYFLATAVGPCGSEGPHGFARNSAGLVARPPSLPGGCP